MSIKVVHVGASLAASVALPRVGVAMEASMQKVERLIWKYDVAMLALPLTGQSMNNG